MHFQSAKLPSRHVRARMCLHKIHQEAVLNSHKPSGLGPSRIHCLEICQGEVEMVQSTSEQRHDLGAVVRQDNSHFSKGKHFKTPFNSHISHTYTYNYACLKKDVSFQEEMYLFGYHLLNRGNMFEDSIKVLKELKSSMLERKEFNYSKMGEIHEKLGQSYQNILQKPRLCPQYYKVAFSGKGHPGKISESHKKCFYNGLHLA